MFFILVSLCYEANNRVTYIWQDLDTFTLKMGFQRLTPSFKDCKISLFDTLSSEWIGGI